MKKILPFFFIAVGIFAYAQDYFSDDPGIEPTRSSTKGDSPQRARGRKHPPKRSSAAKATSRNTVTFAFKNKKSDIQVNGEGTVRHILPDDNEGKRHQKFLLDLSSGVTLLIAHNIDLAPRIKGLKKGDEVAFFGEYEWSQKGGVVHWTHRDPQKRHPGGWLKHQGRTYQ